MEPGGAPNDPGGAVFAGWPYAGCPYAGWPYVGWPYGPGAPNAPGGGPCWRFALLRRTKPTMSTITPMSPMRLPARKAMAMVANAVLKALAGGPTTTSVDGELSGKVTV